MRDLRVRARRRVAFGHDRRSALDDVIFRFRARRVLAALPPSVDVVADLGSGHDYRLLRHLRSTGRARRGIAVDLTLDRDHPMPGVELLEADLARPLEIASESVDVVLSLAVLEHLDDPHLHLREAHRILRPGGRLVLTSPAPASQPMLEFLAYRLHVIDEQEIRDHRRYFGESDIRAELTRAGFHREAVGYKRFLFGLNQLAFAKRAASVAGRT